jgi:predicted TIM-barrel fold metal-dependent hydrolase
MSTDGQPAQPPVVDCDVHCAIPSRQALYPYLTEHWVKYMEETSYKLPAAIENTYPSWSSALATPPGSPERLREEVLDRATYAILNCYYGAESYTHPYFASALASAVNQWLQAEWLDADERLLAGAVVTPEHATQAVAEIERIAEDQRFVQIMVPARSLEPYGNERFWPVWEAAAERGLVVGIHYGGAPMHPQTMVGYVHTAYDSYANAPSNFQAQITNLVFSGIFERCPDLRFAVIESGWTWLPALMWKLDQEWKAFRREVPWITSPPSEYVRRHFRFTTQPTDAPPTAQEFEHLLQQLGSDELLMYASDFPHTYGDEAERLLAVLSPDQARRVLWTNAAKCYGLEARLAHREGVVPGEVR